MSSGKGVTKPLGSSTGDLSKGKSKDDYGRGFRAKQSKNDAEPWRYQSRNPNPKPWDHQPYCAKNYRAPPSPAAENPNLNLWGNHPSAMAADDTEKNKKIQDTIVVAQPEPEDKERDDSESDCSEESHEMRNTDNCIKAFLKNLDALPIDDPERKWPCLVCQGKSGQYKYYKGLHPLLSHASSIQTCRIKDHRKFAELLEEVIKKKRISTVRAGEAFGKWTGLENVKDKVIVRPPMVVIMNTNLGKDNTGKSTGMGSRELLTSFDSYGPIKVKHSYGPHGHRGMSILVFENTATGYLDADRLSRSFEIEGTHEKQWNSERVLLARDGKSLLYGYMAEKVHVDFVNKHARKIELKYDMRSYLESVVSKVKQMSEDNKLLIWLDDRIAEVQRQSEKLRKEREFAKGKEAMEKKVFPYNITHS